MIYMGPFYLMIILLNEFPTPLHSIKNLCCRCQRFEVCLICFAKDTPAQVLSTQPTSPNFSAPQKHEIPFPRYRGSSVSNLDKFHVIKSWTKVFFWILWRHMSIFLSLPSKTSQVPHQLQQLKIIVKLVWTV